MTASQQGRWYDAQPDGDYTCSDCGRVGPKYYVQPQPGGGARCGDCMNARNARLRAARKAQLAAEPRCEVPGCKRRANYTVGYVVGMCGRHKEAAKRAAYRGISGSAAGLALAMFGAGQNVYDRATLIDMAERS